MVIGEKKPFNRGGCLLVERGEREKLLFSLLELLGTSAPALISLAIGRAYRASHF